MRWVDVINPNPLGCVQNRMGPLGLMWWFPNIVLEIKMKHKKRSNSMSGSISWLKLIQTRKVNKIMLIMLYNGFSFFFRFLSFSWVGLWLDLCDSPDSDLTQWWLELEVWRLEYKSAYCLQASSCCWFQSTRTIFVVTFVYVIDPTQ